MLKHLFIFALVILVSYGAVAQTRTAPDSKHQIELSYAPLVKKVAPAVINIYTKRIVTRRMSPFMSDPFFEQFFGNSFGYGGRGLNRQRVESALGSGVIVDPEGLIVTNAHVVNDADEITVVLLDGREFAAEKVLIDPPSDLALLRIDGQGEPLPYVALRPSETLEVGDLVLAIGNPFGVGQTVTGGIVSALSRSSLNISDFNFFIQTDAAINPGNSGGALVAMDGGVVGINTAIYSRNGGSMGLGFAIPSEMIATVIAAEKSGQSGKHGITRPWLGLSALEVTQDLADNLSLKNITGVFVSNLHKDSPATKSGIKIGDIILSVDGKQVRDPSEMKFRMATIPLGTRTLFKVLRGDKTLTFEVEAIAPPDIPPRQQTDLMGAHPLNGAIIANINPAVSLELGIDDEAGVVIVGVANGSSASRVVGPGDIVMEVNGQKITKVNELKSSLSRAGIQRWDFMISRQGRIRKLLIR